MDDLISINSISVKKPKHHALQKLSLQNNQQSLQNLNAEQKDNEHITSNHSISLIPLVKENSFLIGNNDEYNELNGQSQNILSRQDEEIELKADNLDLGIQTVQMQTESYKQDNQDYNKEGLNMQIDKKDHNNKTKARDPYQQILSSSIMNSSQKFHKISDKIIEDDIFIDDEEKLNQNKFQQEQQQSSIINTNTKTQNKRKRHQQPTDAEFDDLTGLNFEFQTPFQQKQKNQQKEQNQIKKDEKKIEPKVIRKKFDYIMFNRQREILYLITNIKLKNKNIQIKKYVDYCQRFLPFKFGKIQLEGNINLLTNFMDTVIIPFILILNHYKANKLLPIMSKLDQSQYFDYCYQKSVDLKLQSNIVQEHILIRMCKELSWRIQLYNTIILILTIILMAYRIAILVFRYEDFEEFNDGNLKYPRTGLDRLSFAHQILFLLVLTINLGFYIKGLLFYIKKHIRISQIFFIISLVFNILAFCFSMVLFQKPRPVKYQLSVWAERHQIILFCLNLLTLFFGFICTTYTIVYCKRIECFLQIEQSSKLIDL